MELQLGGLEEDFEEATEFFRNILLKLVCENC